MLFVKIKYSTICDRLIKTNTTRKGIGLNGSIMIKIKAW